MTAPIALIGAGAMGSAIGARLVATGTPLVVFDLDPAKVAALTALGAQSAASAAAAARSMRRSRRRCSLSSSKAARGRMPRPCSGGPSRATLSCHAVTIRPSGRIDALAATNFRSAPAIAKPIVLRAPTSGISMRIGFEHALRDRLAAEGFLAS